ncbi:type II toxin-antitoxin system RelE family toxin [Streptomyces phaeochromogenes]|uniref:type II toxin-antitoxin system RelE family toxin n=1 Tax=Streptomyces phaeochromogenes TaxID=1923 RepID=UPI00316AC16E
MGTCRGGRPATPQVARRRCRQAAGPGINSLALQPEPPESSKLGGTDLRRLRVGAYRVTYEIDGARVAIKVLMVGRTQV